MIALLLMPVFLYFLIDTSSTKGIQHANFVLLNDGRLTDDTRLRIDEHIEVSDKYIL